VRLTHVRMSRRSAVVLLFVETGAVGLAIGLIRGNSTLLTIGVAFLVAAVVVTWWFLPNLTSEWRVPGGLLSPPPARLAIGSIVALFSSLGLMEAGMKAGEVLGELAQWVLWTLAVLPAIALYLWVKSSRSGFRELDSSS